MLRGVHGTSSFTRTNEICYGTRLVVVLRPDHRLRWPPLPHGSTPQHVQLRRWWVLSQSCHGSSGSFDGREARNAASPSGRRGRPDGCWLSPHHVAIHAMPCRSFCSLTTGHPPDSSCLQQRRTGHGTPPRQDFDGCWHYTATCTHATKRKTTQWPYGLVHK